MSRPGRPSLLKVSVKMKQLGNPRSGSRLPSVPAGEVSICLIVRFPGLKSSLSRSSSLQSGKRRTQFKTVSDLRIKPVRDLVFGDEAMSSAMPVASVNDFAPLCSSLQLCNPLEDE
jgi:hypothetical protein